MEENILHLPLHPLTREKSTMAILVMLLPPPVVIVIVSGGGSM
jgi:hypothetical protein